MDEKEVLKERFKSAITSTVKAISENFDIEIKFGMELWQNFLQNYDKTWKKKENGVPLSIKRIILF